MQYIHDTWYLMLRMVQQYVRSVVSSTRQPGAP